MTKGRWALLTAFFLAAFWPRFVDLDDLPAHPLANAYRKEATNTFWLAHDNPVEQAWFGLLTQNFLHSDWTWDATACDGGSTSFPELRNIRTRITALGPWGIPLARDTISCGGAAWSRGTRHGKRLVTLSSDDIDLPDDSTIAPQAPPPPLVETEAPR